MDMHIVVKKVTGRTWYAMGSGMFWHTNAGQFQSTVDAMNKANDGKFIFDILEYNGNRKPYPHNDIVYV